MDVCIRSRITTGFAVVGVGALVMAPMATGQTADAPTPAPPPVVMLTAATQPLPPPRLLAQPTQVAPVQQLVPPQPQNPLAQQVAFHVAFVGDFLSTGAVLFAREFAIPGALLDDIHNGTPAPVAVSRALQTFAQIELEAGRELVGFAAEYVSFQLNFFANLATMPIAVVSAFAAPHVQAAAASVDAVATPKADVERTSATSKKTGTDIEQPKKIRSTVPESDSTTGTTAKTRDKDGDPAASDQADSDAAAPTAHGKPDVTQKQPKTGSTTSPTTSGAGQADAGSPHEPQHEHRGNAKDGGDKGD